MAEHRETRDPDTRSSKGEPRPSSLHPSETPAPPQSSGPPYPPGLRTPPPRSQREHLPHAEPRHPLQLTNLDRVIFPDPGYTKRDVLAYYEAVSPWLLPCLRDRPITIERYPEGLTGPDAPHFWQKNIPAYYPDWIPRIALHTEEHKPVEYALINDLDTLLYLVNLGTLTFHVFLSKTRRLHRPDFVLFDIDPGEASWTNTVITARQLHLTLDALDVPSYPKTSGKTGLHILVPWHQDGGYDEARTWALWVAQRAAELSDIATTERLKSKRNGRVYIDVLQNALGHHVVPPYVLRPTPHATVSTPISWSELTRDLDPAAFNLKTTPTRLKAGKPDPMLQLFDQ